MPSYHLYSTIRGKFFFTLFSPKGHRLLQSVMFRTRETAAAAVEDCRQCSPIDDRYQRLETARGWLYFDLQTLADSLLASSETFLTEAQREDGISQCKRYGPVARFDPESPGGPPLRTQ
ncbi:MAG: hypothetical protein IT430_19370 [Phycisphaerales bacterium]|nr:hypothetical protein [Phycisphaerales bacterium]